MRYRQSYWISGQGSKTQEIVYERNGRKVSRPKRPSEHSAPTYGTINKELTVIRQIFAYACEKDLVSQTEIPAIKNLSKPKNYDEDHERPSFTEHELDTVFRTVTNKWVGQGNSKHKLAHMRLLYYMMLLALTGMRVTEAKNLKFSAFQTYQHNGEEQLKVLVGGKGKQRLITPLDGCAELIRKWKNHHKKNAEMHGWTFSDDIHVLTNEHGRRIKSHDTALNHLLEECNLLHDPQGRKRNAGSFRSQYITAALTNSNLTHYQIAVNCGTSVEVIERHYSRMQSIHIPEKFKFRSIVNEYF